MCSQYCCLLASIYKFQDTEWKVYTGKEELATNKKNNLLNCEAKSIIEVNAEYVYFVVLDPILFTIHIISVKCLFCLTKFKSRKAQFKFQFKIFLNTL